MTSKKPAQQKRANPPRSSDSAKSFRKDWERLSHSGRYDMRRLKEAMLLLIANEGPIPPEYRDHELTGDRKGFRECHIGGDFLLVYLLREYGYAHANPISLTDALGLRRKAAGGTLDVGQKALVLTDRTGCIVMPTQK